MCVPLLCAPGADTAAREFRVAANQPEDYPSVQAVVQMGRRLAEQTGGRLQFKVFADSQLGEEHQTIDQTLTGAIDVNRVNAAPLAAIVPEAIPLALPFLFSDREAMRRAFQGPVGDEILAAFEAHGLIGLALYDGGARSVYTIHRPVRSLEDLKGLRIRVQNSEISLATFRALGADPIALPYGHVMTALATGLVEGAENDLPSYHESGHFRVARHFGLTMHSMAPDVLVMSVRAWSELSPEDRLLVRKAARESVAVMHRLWMEREVWAEVRVREAGAEITPLADRSALTAAVEPVYRQMVTDPGVRDLLRRLREAGGSAP
jgi:tripartite ATP-independent transporter DctP family solute receptor